MDMLRKLYVLALVVAAIVLGCYTLMELLHYVPLMRQQIIIFKARNPSNLVVSERRPIFAHKVKIDKKAIGYFKGLPRPNLTFVLNNEDLCEIKGLHMLVYIYTIPKDFEKRQLIRNTWGNYQFLKTHPFRVAFIIGYGDKNDTVLQAKLTNESQVHRDIIQGNFIDSYHNLSYKAALVFKWISMYCLNSKFVLKVDSDTFVDIMWLQRTLKKEYRSDVPFIACWMTYGVGPFRPNAKGKCSNKWCVKMSDYTDTKYPSYCQGMAFFMSTDTVPFLHIAASEMDIFWIDDVWVTGILPRVLSGVIKHRSVYNKWDINVNRFKKKLLKLGGTALFCVMENPKDMIESWNITKKRKQH